MVLQAGKPQQFNGPAARVIAAVILAVSLGYIEAAIVVYLRAIIAPVREVHYPDTVDEVVPVLTLEQLEQARGPLTHLMATEVGREMTPIVVLLAVAWGMARTWRQFAGLFLLCFGVWDIFYYVWLKVLIGWPASLGTWDLLFLIPTAWVAPVWAPLLAAATMAVGGGVLALQSPRRGRARWAWLAVAAGIALILTSFFLRTGEAFSRTPAAFDWPWFMAGWAIATAGLARLTWPGTKDK